MLKKGLFYFFALFFGVVTGVVIIFVTSLLPLPVNNSLYSLLGIQKNHVVGFQPYWLLNNTQESTQKYISTYSYFGLTIGSDGRVTKLVSKTQEEPGWTALRTGLSQKNKPLFATTSLVVQNFDEGSITKLISSPEKHAHNLVTDVAPIMKKYHFSDLNFDIESFQEVSPDQQKLFTRFMKQLKKEMDLNHLGTISMDVSPTALVKRYLINISQIEPLVDSIILMTYDYHYSGSFNAGPVAPLDGAPDVTQFDVSTAVKEAVEVVPPRKLLLGVPLYGYEWETLSSKPGSAVIPGSAATASNRRVEELLSPCTECAEDVDPYAQEPYVISPDKKVRDFHQIYYENNESVKKKLELAKSYNLGGVAFWALGYEGDTVLSPVSGYKKQVIWQ